MVYIVFALIQAFSTGISRAILQEAFAGENELEALFFYIGSILYTMLCIFINVFYLTAYYDYDRIAFCHQQLSQMYSPDHIPNIQEKIFPTVNLADAVSLQSWISMRKVINVYGKPYMNRHQIFTSLLLLVCVVSGIFLLIAAYIDQWVNKLQTNVTDGLFKLVGPATIIFMFYGKMFIFLVRKQQLINDQSNNHLKLIRDNQQIFQTFHHFRDLYIGESKDKELPYKIKDIFTTESDSFVHKKMATECKRLLHGKDHIANEYIEKLVKLQGEFIKEIKKEAKFFVKTMLGWEIDFATMSIIFVIYCIILGSIYVTQWQDRILNMTD